MLATGKQFLLLVILLVLFIYTVKSGKSLGSDRGNKTSTYIVNDPLLFEIWIFRNGQPDCDDDLSIFVAMTST